MNKKGHVLLELLLVVAVIALLVGITAPLVYVSIHSSENSNERQVAAGLLQETMVAVKATARGEWVQLYTTTKASVDYYPVETSGVWSVTTGTEQISNDVSVFTRSFIVQNVCRDSVTKNITGVTDSNGADNSCVEHSGSEDPSTQKITATVRWANDVLSMSVVDYVTRWPNTYCVQTQWETTSTVGAEVCPSAAYVSSTGIRASSSIVLCSSGC